MVEQCFAVYLHLFFYNFVSHNKILLKLVTYKSYF